VNTKAFRIRSNASKMVLTTGVGAPSQSVTEAAGKRKSVMPASLPLGSPPGRRKPNLFMTSFQGLPQGSVSTWAQKPAFLFFASRMAVQCPLLATLFQVCLARQRGKGASVITCGESNSFCTAPQCHQTTSRLVACPRDRASSSEWMLRMQPLGRRPVWRPRLAPCQHHPPRR